MTKTELDGFVRYGKLFSCYGKLLSEDRQNIMRGYFDFNMTLTEIAEERKISRQAVLDCIDKSCKKLDDYEEKLSLLKSKETLQKALQDILNEDEKNIKQKVEKLLRKI